MRRRTQQHRSGDNVARKKSHRNNEDSQGEIRKLKSIIRNLQKRLRTYEKFDSYFEDALESIEEAKSQEKVQEEFKADKCPSCKKGELRVLDLGRVTYLACDACKYRRKTHGST